MPPRRTFSAQVSMVKFVISWLLLACTLAISFDGAVHVILIKRVSAI